MHIDVSYGNCVLHSLRILLYRSTVPATRSEVHLQSYIEAVDRTGGENNWPRAVAAVQVVQKRLQLLPIHVHYMPNFAER